MEPVPQVSISTVPAAAVADEPYCITCTATNKAVSGGKLEVVWRDGQGLLVKSTGGLTVGNEVVSDNVSNVTLEFTKVLVESEGDYVCEVTLVLEEFDYTTTVSSSYELLAPGILRG